ncbi:hypothetical protein [Streptomyces sp. NPDC008240]|uniref:hypothetical protein n=1 Tax=Streptomyces sp. NPDC008240 TaxID=3364822 RepID=UPI0036E70658
MTERDGHRLVEYETDEGSRIIMSFRRDPEIDAMTDEDLIREYGTRIEDDLRKRRNEKPDPA